MPDTVRYNQNYHYPDKTRCATKPTIKPEYVGQPKKKTKSNGTKHNTVKIKYNYIAEKKAKERIQNAVYTAYIEYKRGVKEVTKNDSQRIRDYKFGAKNDWDWCAYFTNFCYFEGLGDKRTLFGIDKAIVGRSQEIKKCAEEQGYFSKANTGYTPQTGDLAIWTDKKNSGLGHIGIVYKVNDDGSYDVIEGNKDEKVSLVHYKSQKPKDADLKTKYFAGFVRMEDYLYDLETWKISGALSSNDEPADLYEKDEKSNFGYMA